MSIFPIELPSNPASLVNAPRISPGRILSFLPPIFPNLKAIPYVLHLICAYLQFAINFNGDYQYLEF